MESEQRIQYIDRLEGLKERDWEKDERWERQRDEDRDKKLVEQGRKQTLKTEHDQTHNWSDINFNLM